MTDSKLEKFRDRMLPCNFHVNIKTPQGSQRTLCQSTWLGGLSTVYLSFCNKQLLAGHFFYLDTDRHI